MNLKDHIKNIKNLNLPEGEFVVVSSGTLALHGIRDANDIDLIVTSGVWTDLSSKYKVIEKNGVSVIDLGESIEVLGPRSSYTSPHIVPPEEVFTHTEVYEGIKFMNLTQLRKIKSQSLREKDKADVVLIDKYLKESY